MPQQRCTGENYHLRCTRERYNFFNFRGYNLWYGVYRRLDPSDVYEPGRQTSYWSGKSEVFDRWIDSQNFLDLICMTIGWIKFRFAEFKEKALDKSISNDQLHLAFGGLCADLQWIYEYILEEKTHKLPKNFARPLERIKKDAEMLKELIRVVRTYAIVLLEQTDRDPIKDIVPQLDAFNFCVHIARSDIQRAFDFGYYYPCKRRRPPYSSAV